MSLKENVNFVKEELNSEEKFLESFVKVERFYKKNKALIIGAALVILIAVIGINVKNYMDQQDKIDANIAFEQVQKNPNNEAALATLKSTNKHLYEIALYQKAQKENKIVKVDVNFFKNISLYQEALKEQSISKLNDLSMERDFLLKEFAIFNKALLEAKTGKFSEAKTSLKLIPAESKAYELVKILNHYLLTK